ncbi:LPXTG cell wall anchor domain-containing protein [Micromonospora sp. CPCC 205539]|uniref:LPXTG cell wall anchor domain-containing protein n=1 Tax=Micromonospora sp. CPCC 205539 TaxID=3122408 RepID=UPI002FEFFDFB
MISFRLWRRRPMAALGAAVVSLAGTLVFTAPASADPPHPSVNHEVRCTADGTYEIRWTILAEAAPTDATRYRFVKVELYPSGTTVDNIAASPEGDFPHSVGKPVIGTQTLPGTATGAELLVWMQWDDGYNEPSGFGASTPLDGRCGQPPTEPTVTIQSRCDGSMLVDLANPPAGRTVDLVIVSAPAGFSRTVTLGPGGSANDIVVPRGFDIVSVINARNGETVGQHFWAFDPSHCATPDIRTRATCDEFVITVTESAAHTNLIITFDPNHGREQRRTIPVGTTADVSFRAVAGLAVTLRSDQFDPQAGHLNGPYLWQQPAGCGIGGGGGLPVTGQSTGGVVASAGLLLVVGAALFVLARRRRVRFTV